MLTRQDTDRYIKLGVRLIALMLIVRAMINVIHDFRFALLWEFNPFGEIPDAWYLMTNQWHATWGNDLFAVFFAILLFTFTSPIATWCQSRFPDWACPFCGYTIGNLQTTRCPECGNALE